MDAENVEKPMLEARIVCVELWLKIPALAFYNAL